MFCEFVCTPFSSLVTCRVRIDQKRYSGWVPVINSIDADCDDVFVRTKLESRRRLYLTLISLFIFSSFLLLFGVNDIEFCNHFLCLSSHERHLHIVPLPVYLVVSGLLLRLKLDCCDLVGIECDCVLWFILVCSFGGPDVAR